MVFPAPPTRAYSDVVGVFPLGGTGGLSDRTGLPNRLSGADRVSVIGQAFFCSTIFPICNLSLHFIFVKSPERRNALILLH